MTLRSIPDDFDPAAATAIDTLLDAVERDNSARILFAIESGSRAWGFPSPDSDYDCRFVYVRSADQYLSPWVLRDVIEAPLAGDLDVNGWDLGKALKLMLKGNAVIIEWLRSPIVYRGVASFRDEFLELANRHGNRALIARHYLHLGVRQRNTYFGEGKEVALKKMFYALRPAAALRWMRLYPEVALPPMHFPTLLAECEPTNDVAGIVAELLERKAATNELGTGLLPEPVRAFIDAEFATATQRFGRISAVITAEAKADVDGFFRKWVRRLAP